MQPLILTEAQKNLLQWLVEQVRAGILTEEEIWFSWSLLGTYDVVDYQGKIPEIKKQDIDALYSSGLLVCDKGKSLTDVYKCALTNRAYEAVDSDFGVLNLSTIPWLISLAEVQHFDSELWDRCRFSLSTGGDNPKAWDKAVRTALVVLEERLRKLGKTEAVNPDATGENIVNMVFGKNSILNGKLSDKQREAYRNLYAGMMGIFRNSYAHRLIDPSPEVGGAIIAFIDLLLKMLDDIDWDEGDDRV